MSEKMYSFKSTDKFQIAGRGTVYTTTTPVDFKANQWPSIDKDVLIDGEILHCIGIECHAMEHISKGSPIGLLVKDQS